MVILRPWSRRSFRPAIVLLVLAALVGCLREPAPPTDAELARELGISESTPIHRMHLAGSGSTTRVLPSQLELAEGAWLQVVVEDHRVYSFRFLLDEMEPEVAAFLRSTEQTGSPPLAQQGARFVLSFDSAPGGDYPFVVEGYGEAVRGTLRLRDG